MDEKLLFGQRLLELRKKSNKNQADVAKVLGISQPAYQNYENGRREAGYATISKLADFYGVSTDYLLGRETPDDPLEVMGIKVRDVDDDAFIKMYRELPDNAKCVFLDVMKKLAGAAVQESGNTAPEYGPMKHSAVTGDIIADTEAEKDA